MAVGRSPNYPRFTLEEALEKIKGVYNKQHNYPADKGVVAVNLGYGGINGGSQAMMGALSSYGLLIKEGNQFKVSDEAVSIIELPNDSNERIDLIKSIASNPDVFAVLDTEFSEKIPQNEVIRHFLVKKKFLPKAASEVIRIYRANLEFVNNLESSYNYETENDSSFDYGSSNKMQTQQSNNPIQAIPPPLNGGSQVIVNISPIGEINISFSGSVDELTFEVLNGIRGVKEKAIADKKQHSHLTDNPTTDSPNFS